MQDKSLRKKIDDRYDLELIISEVNGETSCVLKLEEPAEEEQESPIIGLINLRGVKKDEAEEIYNSIKSKEDFKEVRERYLKLFVAESAQTAYAQTHFSDGIYH